MIEISRAKRFLAAARIDFTQFLQLDCLCVRRAFDSGSNVRERLKGSERRLERRSQVLLLLLLGIGVWKELGSDDGLLFSSKV